MVTFLDNVLAFNTLYSVNIVGEYEELLNVVQSPG